MLPNLVKTINRKLPCNFRLPPHITEIVLSKTLAHLPVCYLTNIIGSLRDHRVGALVQARHVECFADAYF